MFSSVLFLGLIRWGVACFPVSGYQRKDDTGERDTSPIIVETGIGDSADSVPIDSTTDTGEDTAVPLEECEDPLAGLLSFASANITFIGKSSSLSSGLALNSVGDVNGDGSDDFMLADFYNTDHKGQAYLFFGPLEGEINIGDADLIFDGQKQDAYLGFSFDGQDIDRDGYSDLLIGVPFFGVYSGDNYGRALYFDGYSIDSLPHGTVLVEEDATVVFAAEDVGTATGFSVSMAGDFDGDGINDIAIGAPFSVTAGEEYERNGQVYIVTDMLEMSDGKYNLSDATYKISGTSFGNIGYQVDLGCDYDGDGRGDLLVNVPFYSDGISSRALIYFSGLEAGNYLEDEANVELVGGSAMGKVACAGDINGDGYDDASTTSPFFIPDEVLTDEIGEFADGYTGAVNITFGGPAMLSSVNYPAGEADVLVYGAGIGSQYGLGDINSDGYDDLLVGAQEYGKLDRQGGAFLFYGGLAGFYRLEEADAWLYGEVSEDWVGYAVGSAGDQNGDGYADIAVAAPGNDAGQALVYYSCGAKFKK